MGMWEVECGDVGGGECGDVGGAEWGDVGMWEVDTLPIISQCSKLQAWGGDRCLATGRGVSCYATAQWASNQIALV